ncbi:protegrin-2-like isoform X2 [Lepisosteus oculatus]|uniref:protegrin-2-like isoform X2 n=1 Tax=Lepisosteus oculatus TaxID=7918 RepID=UPI003712A352
MKTSAGSLLLLSLAAAVSGSLEEAVFSPQDTLYAAVEFYNRGSEQLNAFKEESALHEPRRREDDSSVYYKLKFTMRETVCPNTENFNKLYCSFMEGGEI